MSTAARDILEDWSLPVWLTCSLLVLAAVYFRGWLAIRKTRPTQFTITRLLSYCAGLIVLWIAIASPMDGFADVLLSVHMIEHLLLMSLVPPLLLYAFPMVPLLRGLPHWLMRVFVAPGLRAPSLRSIGHWLVIPAVAWVLMNLTFLGWHIPAAYNFALEHENWHALEHLCFLWSSLLFWWCVLQPWPARSRSHWGILIWLLAADVVNTALSAFLAFVDRPVYSFYLTHPNPFHVSPSADQTLGAVIMWVVGSVAFLVPAIVITTRLLARKDLQT